MTDRSRYASSAARRSESWPSGNIYLRSLNRARKDCDYNIMATGNDTVKCFGTVIAERVPLVED